MNRRLRKTLAGLSLAAAVTTGILTTATVTVTPPDTAWGAHTTTQTPVTPPAVDDIATPMDTAWG